MQMNPVFSLSAKELKNSKQADNPNPNVTLNQANPIFTPIPFPQCCNCHSAEERCSVMYEGITLAYEYEYSTLRFYQSKKY